MPTVHVYFRAQVTGDASAVQAIADAAEALAAAIAEGGGEPTCGSVTVVEDVPDAVVAPAPPEPPEPEFAATTTEGEF